MFNSIAQHAIVLASIFLVASNGFNIMPPPPPPPPPTMDNGMSNHLEWDGHANDDVFYDVVYDDLEECPVKGNAVPNSAFYGSVFKVVLATSHAECMLVCHRDARCRSINVQAYDHWSPSSKTQTQEKPFVCQLNEFNQYNSPFLLIQRPGVVFYEDIRCDRKSVQTIVPQHTRVFESINIEERDHKNSESDSKFKLNRLLMLEKVMKMFQKHQNID